MVDYAVGVLALHGHDPREVREWPWRDVLLALSTKGLQ